MWLNGSTWLTRRPVPGGGRPTSTTRSCAERNKQHRRFIEFADAVRRHRYIDACYGAPGLGKALSARTYAAADDWERWAVNCYFRETTLPAGLLSNRTLFYTAPVAITARRLLLEIEIRASVLGRDIDRALDPNHDPEFDDHKLDVDCSTELGRRRGG